MRFCLVFWLIEFEEACVYMLKVTTETSRHFNYVVRCLYTTDFIQWFNVSIVDFEQVNAGCEGILISSSQAVPTVKKLDPKSFENSQSIWKIQEFSCHVWYGFNAARSCWSRYSMMYQVKFLKDCLPQILLGPFLNTLSHVYTMEFTLRRTIGNLTHLSLMFHLIPQKTSENLWYLWCFQEIQKRAIGRRGHNGLFEVGR